MLGWLRKLLKVFNRPPLDGAALAKAYSPAAHAETAQSVLTLLSPDNVAKYLSLAQYDANASLIALHQQTLENQKSHLLLLVTNQTRITYQLAEIAVLLGRLLPGPAAHIQIVEEDMGFTIGVDDPPKRFRIKITDSHGNPATVDGAPVWSTGDGSVLTVTQDADGMAAAIAGVGPAAATQLLVTADADLGAGVQSIIGTTDITVAAGQASAIVLEPEV